MGNTTDASATGAPSPGVVSAVAGLIPLLVQHIPLEPAAILGRLGAGEQRDPRPRHQQHPRVVQHRAVGGGPHESAVLAALRGVDPMLAERLLGSLELAVGSLHPAIPEGLTVPEATARGSVSVLSEDSQGAATRAVVWLDAMHPDLSGAALALAVALAADEAIRPLLVGESDSDPHGQSDEQEIAARHGASYLALGVATAAVILSALKPRSDSAAATIGIGTGIAAELLTDAAMPAGYANAQLAKQRLGYLMPRMSTGSVVVNDHRFAVVESATEESVDFTGNGLVDVVPGGIVIRTGIEQGQLPCYLRVVAEEPAVDGSVWDEVVDISWTATRGGATAPGFRDRTPPWPVATAPGCARTAGIAAKSATSCGSGRHQRRRRWCTRHPTRSVPPSAARPLSQPNHRRPATGGSPSRCSRTRPPSRSSPIRHRRTCYVRSGPIRGGDLAVGTVAAVRDRSVGSGARH